MENIHILLAEQLPVLCVFVCVCLSLQDIQGCHFFALGAAPQHLVCQHQSSTGAISRNCRPAQSSVYQLVLLFVSHLGELFTLWWLLAGCLQSQPSSGLVSTNQSHRTLKHLEGGASGQIRNDSDKVLGHTGGVMATETLNVKTWTFRIVTQKPALLTKPIYFQNLTDLQGVILHISPVHESLILVVHAAQKNNRVVMSPSTFTVKSLEQAPNPQRCRH